MKVFRVTIPVIMMVPEDHNRAICGIDSEIDEHWAFESAIHLSDTIEDAILNYGLGKVEIDGITAAELRPSASNERCQDSPKSTLDSIQSELVRLSETIERQSLIQEEAEGYTENVYLKLSEKIEDLKAHMAMLDDRCDDLDRRTDARPDLYADLRVGDYVHFKQDWDLQPIATVRSGMTGTVTVKNEDGIWIKIDQDLNTSEDYDNSIHFNRDTFRSCDGESLESYVLPLNF